MIEMRISRIGRRASGIGVSAGSRRIKERGHPGRRPWEVHHKRERIAHGLLMGGCGQDAHAPWPLDLSMRGRIERHASGFLVLDAADFDNRRDACFPRQPGRLSYFQECVSGLRQFRVLRLIGAMLLMGSPVASAYYDDTAGDKQVAYEYLDQVEKDVGYEAFVATPEALTLQLALTLGKLDKVHLTSEAFIQHLQQVATAKDRFYPQRKLTTDEVVAYLLPYRIRYEHTSKPGWLTTLARKFAPLTATATTADEAAKVVLAWIPAHVKLLDPALSYPLPIRGDLDPLTVLKGGYGSEVDCAIFGVAALRSAGVAARFVWAPALRGEAGGKAWLEYLGEAGQWIPWVPSYGAVPDHLAEIRKSLGSGIIFVMARPEEPVEITGSYVETMRVEIIARQENVTVQLMVVGRDGLVAAHGNEIMGSGLGYDVGRGPLIVAATFSNRAFALLPVERPPAGSAILVLAEAGKLSIGQPDNPIGQESQTNR